MIECQNSRDAHNAMHIRKYVFPIVKFFQQSWSVYDDTPAQFQRWLVGNLNVATNPDARKGWWAVNWKTVRKVINQKRDNVGASMFKRFVSKLKLLILGHGCGPITLH